MKSSEVVLSEATYLVCAAVAAGPSCKVQRPVLNKLQLTSQLFEWKVSALTPLHVVQ